MVGAQEHTTSIAQMWTKMWTKKSSLYNYVFKINYLKDFYGGGGGIRRRMRYSVFKTGFNHSATPPTLCVLML